MELYIIPYIIQQTWRDVFLDFSRGPASPWRSWIQKLVSRLVESNSVVQQDQSIVVGFCSLPMTDPAGAGILMLAWLRYIDGIHVTNVE